VNVLSKVAGTPFEKNEDVSVWETVRMIATARIVMPKTVVRLSAGRSKMSEPEQAMCFMAGANSIFSSEEKIMLTKAAASPDYDQDRELLNSLGLTMRPPFKDAPRPVGGDVHAASAESHSHAAGGCCGHHNKCSGGAEKAELIDAAARS
jgi:biotin synthase